MSTKERRLYEKAVAERDAAYREQLKSERTSSLIRMLVDEEYRSSIHWQERLVEEELDARLPPRTR